MGEAIPGPGPCSFSTRRISWVAEDELQEERSQGVNRTIDGDLRVVLDGSSFWTDRHHCILHYSSLPEKEHN